MVQNGRCSRHAALRGGVLLGALAVIGGLTAPAAVAQTTTTLVVVKDSTIRGGSYATTRHGREQILVTRKSDDSEYERRSVLTFDTDTTIPARATIQSATLVLTVRGGNSETRQLAAYSVPVSFDNDDVTWRQRKSGLSWSHAGGDITGSPASATASATVGSQVTFNVTSQVQRVVNGDYGSRYARFLVADAGSSSRDSYREYHALESSTSSARPRLIVTYGGSTSGSTSTAVATPDSAGDILLTPDHVSARAGRWVVENNSGALSGRVVRHPDGGAGKISTAAASPSNYFEMQFHAEAGRAYRIWLRGRADQDHWANDSVFVQFSGSVTSSGSATWRIGTTSATEINLEECSGCGLTGWMWRNNGWGSPGVLGPEVRFATTGTQRIRIQTREDGLAIDRIILSHSTYASTSPGGTSSTPPATSTPTSEPAPAPSGSSTLRVLHWNIHHGTTATGVYDLDLQATWIARTNPDVVSLNEVERYTGWGNEDQPARFASLLRSKTGHTWYYHFASRSGATNAQGNLILSRYPIESSSSRLLSYNRSAAQVRITVNGRSVNVFSTHLDADSSSRRATQMEELKTWARGFPEQRIIAGDFNTWPTAGEIPRMTGTHFDVWAEAERAGTAVAFSGNSGQTRNSRIDYIFLSHGASNTVIRGAQVFDTRDSSGVMASDHRPLLGIFEIR